MKKFVDYFNNLNDQARYAVFAGVIILIIAIDVFLLVLPQMGMIADVNDQIKKLSEDTQQVINERLRINYLKTNLREAHDQLGSLNGKVRLTQEVPGILSTISSIANDNGVKIDQLVPEKDQQETLQDTKDGKYYSLPILIKARCGYHMFGRFLNKLEDENMYLILKDFIIQNDDKSSSTHLFSLTIKIILLDKH